MIIGVAVGLPFTKGKKAVQTIVSDTFNRADSTSLGNADTGQSWETLQHTPNIKNNKFVATIDSMDNMAVINSGVSDGLIKATLNNGNSLYGTWIVFRATTYSDWWMARISSDGSLQVFKKQAGSETLMASYAGGYSDTTDHDFEVKLLGDSIKVSVNGIERISITNSFNQTATKHGLNGTSTNVGAAADNFQVEV